jgi:hypothetical protein
MQQWRNGGNSSPVLKDLIDMSHLISASSNGRASRVTRLTAAMRRTWADARYADRRLMEMRTKLSRVSG